jgi:hypothetical protein
MNASPAGDPMAQFQVITAALKPRFEMIRFPARARILA